MIGRPGIPGRRAPSGRTLWLCWLVLALDGYDLVVLGAVIPTLSAGGALGFTDASLTTAATLGLVGVGIGALGVGPITDRWGRRRTLIGCTLGFSLLCLGVGLAPGLGTFIALRLLSGVFLGAALPVSLALVGEQSGRARRARATTRMMTGYHVGAVAASCIAYRWIGEWGWRPMFVIGAVAGLILVPVLWRSLEESPRFLEPRAEQAQVVRSVVRGGWLAIGVAFWVTSFMGLLLVYGLNTWLPKIMQGAGYSVSGGIGLLVVLNVGAVVGLLLAGRVADGRGDKPTVQWWFGLSALFLALLSVRIDSTVLVHLAVAAAGIFVFSSQVLVYAFMSRLYPDAVRGTALGLAAGIGRIGAIVGPFLGGALVTAGVAYPWGFFAFAVAAVAGGLAVSLVPRSVAGSDPGREEPEPSDVLPA